MIPPILSALLYCNSPVLFTQRLLIKSPQVKFIPLQKTNVGVSIFKVSFSNGRKGFLSTLKKKQEGEKESVEGVWLPQARVLLPQDPAQGCCLTSFC